MGVSRPGYPSFCRRWRERRREFRLARGDGGVEMFAFQRAR